MSEDAARAYVRELAERLDGVLGERLVGVYLIGSLALGGYEPGRSDVDVAAVVATPLEDEVKRAVVAACRHAALPCPARKLELVVYARERAPAFELNLNTCAAEPLRAGLDAAAEPSFWFVLDLAIARTSSWAVLGPPAGAVLPEQPRTEVVAAARDALAWALANAPVDDLVLNAARTRRFLEEGVWSSKADAAEWALAAVPEPEVVRAALAVRRGEPGAELTRDRASAYARAYALPAGSGPVDRAATGEPLGQSRGVSAASASTGSESLWPRLAELRLVVEACEFDRLHAVLANDFERITTHVRLVGAGADGLGEDISVFREDGTALHEAGPKLPLEGEWTLAGFCEHLAGLELWPAPPEWDSAVRYRNWAFESAALDLALRQAGRPLHDVLGLEPQPVRFVNSLGLGEEPSIEPVRRRLARSPGVRFKLDAEVTWTAALVDEVAATGAVDTIDFKGQYNLEVEDPEALGALYDHVLTAFPHAYLEDPHDLPGIAQRLGDHLERVSYDAPIHSAEDIGATPLAARVVNVKPARIGSLRPLLEVYARCAREARPMYGGGFGELGVGRGQIELLAALFHADAPNDVAPSAYNEDDPVGSLPGSPLAPRPDATGFRWAA